MSTATTPQSNIGVTASGYMGPGATYNYEAALKEVYRPRAIEIFTGANFLYTFFKGRIKKMKRDAATGKYVTAFKVYPGRSVGARGERDLLPAAANAGFVQSYQSIRMQTATIEFTELEYQNLVQGDTQRKSFYNVWMERHDDAVMGLKDDISRQFWMDGSGILALVAAAGAATDGVGIQVKMPSGSSFEPWQVLKEGQLVTIYRSGAVVTNAAETDNRQIKSVYHDETNEVWKIDLVDTGSDPTVAVDDEIYINGTYNATAGSTEMIGLDGFMRDAAPTSAYRDPYVSSDGTSLSRTSYPFLKAHVIRPSGNTLNPNLNHGGFFSAPLLREARTHIGRFAGNGTSHVMPDVAICEPDCLNWAAEMLDPQKRYSEMSKLDFDWGGEGFKLAGMNWIGDYDCPKGTIRLLRRDTWECHMGGDIDWMTGGGQVSAFQRVPGYAVYRGHLVWIGQPFCTNPRANGVITGLTGPKPAA